MQEYCIQTLSNICFRYVLESPRWGDSNKYPKHMFCEEIRIKEDLSIISFWPLRILYNSKFILMATSLAVVVTRVHCILILPYGQAKHILQQMHNMQFKICLFLVKGSSQYLPSGEIFFCVLCFCKWIAKAMIRIWDAACCSRWWSYTKK